MKFFYILSLLLYVYLTIEINPFFEKGQRAEIFELMDNDISVIKITIPNDEFELLKIKANTVEDDEIEIEEITDSIGYYDRVFDFDKFESNENLNKRYINFDDNDNENENENENDYSEVISKLDNKFYEYIDVIKTTLKSQLELLKKYNIVKMYPNFNFNEFPELKISDKGYCNFDIPELMRKFKFDVTDYQYLGDNCNYVDLEFGVYQSIKDFRILDILVALANVTTFNNIHIDNELVKNLVSYQFYKKDENGNYVYDLRSNSFFDVIYEKKNYEVPENLKNVNNQKIDEHKDRLYKDLEEIIKNIKRKIYLLKKTNLKELYSDFNFEELLPELKINDHGFSNIDVDDVMKGFNIKFENYDNYIEIGYNYHDLNLMIHQNNQNFDLLKVLTTLAEITTFNNSEVDNEFTRRLAYFKFVSLNNVNEYTFDIDGYNSFMETYFNINDDSISQTHQVKNNSKENTNDDQYEQYILELSYLIEDKINLLRDIFKEIKSINLIDEFPDIDFRNELPELKVNATGYSEVNIGDIIRGCNAETDYYVDLDINVDNVDINDLEIIIYQTNKDFDILKIFIKLAKHIYDEKYSIKLSNYLSPFKYCKINDDGSYTFDKETFNEYNFFYNQMKMNTITSDKINQTYKKLFDNSLYYMRLEIELLKKYNLTEMYPNINFDEVLPELKVNEKGYSTVNIDEIINGVVFNPKEYQKFIRKGLIDSFIVGKISYQCNPEFNLIKIIKILVDKTTFSNVIIDNGLIENLVNYKYLTLNNDGTFSYDEESSNAFISEYFDYSNVPDYLEITYDDDLYDNFKYELRGVSNIIENLKEYNLFDLFPSINFTRDLPELKVNEYGYSQIDINEILSNFEFKREDYSNISSNEFPTFKLKVYQTNKSFDLIRIIKYMINKTTYRGIWEKHDLLCYLEFFKFIYKAEDGEYHFDEKRYDIHEKKFIEQYSIDGDDNNDKFKVNNATMIVNIKGNEQTFNEVTLSLSGSYSRKYSKPQYNVKIYDNKDLYGRTQFKLRSDTIDPTFLRSKLVADIHNRLETPSISANYITLYINEEYMGLYLLTDLYKLSWVESVYGDKDSTSLYKCSFSTLTLGDSDCENENESVTDNFEWVDFVKSIENAESIEDIEDILDVEQFLTEMAIEYLTGGWDHIQTGHNYYMFKPNNGKWQYLSYDSDLDLAGHERYPVTRFEDFTRPIHIIDVLILKDSTRFDQIVQDVVNKVFNPAILFPHIDELKDLIRTYVQKDKEMDENGNYPGRLREPFDWDLYSIEEWEANSEFTTINSRYLNYVYGIKYWILSKYRFVCTYYNMDCDPVYMDENYEYSIDKNVEYKDIINKSTFSVEFEKTYKYKDFSPNSVEKSNSTITTEGINTSIASNPTSTTINIATTTTSINSEPTVQQHFKCLSELIGYPCCPPTATDIYAQDEYGDWGYDFINEIWCGLSPIQDTSDNEECWSEKYNYRCCNGCIVLEIDYYGSWGYENNEWCGIISSKCAQKK